MVFLDSCYSGSLPSGTRHGVIRVKKPEMRYQGLTSFAAAGSNEVSNAYKEMGHGLFTYFILKGLSEIGNAGEKKTRLSELVVYTTEQVSQASRRLFGENLRQTPEVGSDLNSANDIVLK